ncbi:MAG: SIR2 family protein, partial [Nitrososphaerales archaeon]
MIGENPKTKTAIVLGAGASTPPLIGQQDLVLKLLTTSGVERLFPAQKYLRTMFPGLRNNQIVEGTLQFEDIVGPLEIAESEEYWFHFGGRKKGHRGAVLTNKTVLDSLDTWVAMALDPESLPKRPGKHEKDPEDRGRPYTDFYKPTGSSVLAYARLVDLLMQLQILETTTFVSMNYDILLDRVLHSSGTHVPDYGIDAFYEKRKTENTDHPAGGSVTVLKLHGSLNWRVCESCHILRDFRELVVWPNDPCSDCEKNTGRPMLIRPTLLKDFRHRVWRDIWRRAGHVLASAEKWVFIGYSLPLADVWMLRLLAQSLKSGPRRPEPRSIVVVNPDQKANERFGLLF